MNLRREAIASSDYWEFQPDERVMTIDGYPGVVVEVQDGPMAGAENYVVRLDNGMGGGNYSASMLSKMPTSRSAAGIHLATDDYPELGTVIDDRPDPGKMTFTAALSQERMEADAEDHDEPGGDDQPHSCSYCGGTEFKDLTDNGRVRQATCAVCNGTMSAHPGMQWTPELIGDPSNHPKATVDPRSGASPGAGAPGQAGINDFIDYNSRVSTTASAEDDQRQASRKTAAFDFQHYDTDTGGTKYPVERTLTAHHPDTGEEVGYAQYYPPKRKGSPISISNIHSEHPGAGSALMDEMESRHPGSSTMFMNARQRDKNTPSHTHGEHGKPTDWDNWHPKLPEEMHRGFSLNVSGWHGRALSKPGASKEEHLDALHHSMPEGPNVGVHWTTHQDLAHRFAQNASTDPRTNIPVVLHAKKPERKDIETRPKELFRHGVFPYDSHNNEFEVPVRRGRTVHVTGISWKPDVEHPDADEHGWLHHTYGEDEVKQHTAAREDSVNTTLLHIAGVPTLSDRVGFSAATAALEARMASDDDDYRMQHRAPDADSGAPLHDVEGMMPGFYQHPHHYDFGQDHFWDSANKIQKAQGNPDHMVRIYRSLPAEHAHKGFNQGDWVTTSKEYAKLHGRHHEDSSHDWPVISTRVPAKHLHTEGDVHEWGYNGPGKSGEVSYKGGFHQEISQRSNGDVAPVKRRPKSPEKLRGEQLAEHGISFSHYKPNQHGEGSHDVVAYDKDDNWAGHIRADSDGKVHEVKIDPKHQHLPLEEHMRSMLPKTGVHAAMTRLAGQLADALGPGSANR